MGTHSSSRRRGASLAACAFGLTLALSGVLPIAAPQALPVAHAAPRTTAVSYTHLTLPTNREV